MDAKREGEESSYTAGERVVEDSSEAEKEEAHDAGEDAEERAEDGEGGLDSGGR